MNQVSPPVAVIDDDDQLRRAFCRVLRAHGFNVLEFSSAEAWLAAEPWPVSCLVLDIDLGGISGLDLYRRLAERDGAHKIPVVFVSGKASPRNEALARSLGAVDFLAKPVDAGLLVAALRRAGATDCT